MTLKTTTATGTVLTASEVRGTGAGTTHLGTPGILPLGDTTRGMTDGITEVGTAHTITEDSTEAGTTLGTGAATGAGMTLGIILTTIADGTADGTLCGDTTITTTGLSMAEEAAGTDGTAQGMKPKETGGSSQTGRLHEEDSAQAAA